MTANVTEAVRRTQVVSAKIRHVTAGEPLFPQFAVDVDCKEVWQGFLITRSGLLPEKYAFLIFLTEQEARDFLASHVPGTYLETAPLSTEVPAPYRVWVREVIDAKAGIDAVGGGDSDSPLAYDVLLEAGVLESGYGVANKVVEFLGKRRVASLKRRFGENWSAAAEYEFCVFNFPQSSPAYVAAAYRYHYYITGDDFAAGYLWRDLECLVHGVETAAIASIAMRQKAGERGSAKSVAARSKRRSDLMAAMEDIASRNPDVVQLGEKAVADLALRQCVTSDPKGWSQGRGQIDQYLGELRRGDAGPELQSRYAALFSVRPAFNAKSVRNNVVRIA